jgi:signal transduction histidine kinase
MRFSRVTTYWWLLAGGIALLAWLGVRQYRWIEKASEAEREERRQFLRNALGGVRNELLERLRRPLATLRPEWSFRPGTNYPALFAARFQQWQREGSDPALLGGVAIAWIEGSGNIRYSRMGAADKAFVDSAWPAALLFYRTDLERHAQLPGSEPPFIPEGNAWGWNGSMLTLIFAIVETDQPPPTLPDGGAGRPPPRRRDAPELRGWCFLEIEPVFLQNLLSGLVLRYFGEAGVDSYLVALRSDLPPRIVYQSAPPGTSWQSTDSADEEVPLFSPPGPGRIPRPREEVDPGKRMAPPPPAGSRNRFSPDPPGWRLLARHKTGSLDEAIGRNRRQSLVFSSSVLLLLLGSGVLLVRSTHRARRLAQQQMEFVAGVSHELRTPLTVINTTSYNLAQGKVSDGRRVQQYGEAIQKEVRRLTTQVEQMLSFAGIESGRKLYDLSPVDVADIIAKALAEYTPAFEAEGWHIERQVEAGLPAAMADARVLESALKNLVENALKYAGAGRWLGIRARAERERERSEIRITVSDHGPGIKPDDLPHIFEPFYRGRNQTAGPAIAGVGLGLSLVQRQLRAMGGRVTVAAASGQGAAFTLHLPAAKPE